MNVQITLVTDCSPLYGFLGADLPDGVCITSAPPVETRGFDFNVNVDISLTVDVTKIAGYAFAVWLITRVRKLKGNHRVNINRKKIPSDQPDAIEILAKEIDETRK